MLTKAFHCIQSCTKWTKISSLWHISLRTNLKFSFQLRPLKSSHDTLFHPPSFNQASNILWILQIIKLLVMYFSPAFCYFIFLMSKYLLKIRSRIIQSNVISKNLIYFCKCKSDREWFWSCQKAKFMIIQLSEHLSSQATSNMKKGELSC
jgi:hypothetical protein